MNVCEQRYPILECKYPVLEQLLERNKVYEGDCLAWLKRFPDNTFTAVVTDPPYGLSKQPDMLEVLKQPR